MAVERVEINEPVQGEQMTLEEQLAKQEAENPQLAEQPQQELSGQNEEQGEENLILGKFKTQEALVEAYENLEKKLGSQQPEEQQENNQVEGTEEGNSPLSNAIEEAAEFYSDKGELSEDHYKELAKIGITKDIVDTYVKGQQSMMASEEAEIMNSIGGQENYSSMAEWARDNLPEDEINSFDQIVQSSTPEAAKMAAKGLYARYLSEAGGQAVNIATGSTSGDAIQPFNSNAQVVEAINDRRYEVDPAYRAEVERRIEVSTNI